MDIDFKSGNTTVCGLTRSGKTYGTIKSLERTPGGVLFFNIQQEECNYKKISKKNTDTTIIKALKEGQKLQYIPERDEEKRERVFQFFTDMLYNANFKKPIYFVIDECHLQTKNMRKNTIELATTGLRFNIRNVFISQRLANIDNTLITQSNSIVFYKTNFEGTYFKTYNIPAEIIKNELEKAGKYYYIQYDFYSLGRPGKVS